MGLESLELLMDIEDEFGIKIENEEGQKTTTVGQLYQLICQKYNPLKIDSCKSQKIFYQLRKVLVSELHIPRKKIHPKAQTEDFFPKKIRKELWYRISERSQLNFPKLVFSKRKQLTQDLFNFSGWLLIAMTLLFGVFIALQVSLVIWFIFWLIVASLLTIILVMAPGSPIGNNIPPSCHTIGGLAQSLMNRNNILCKPYDKEQIWTLLVHMIAEIGCLEEEEIKHESRFIEDLNFG